ncbi:MAG: glycosyl transferase [Marmoricola sp.]|nr:glycosyl transferase [Marmoricola sp.]
MNKSVSIIGTRGYPSYYGGFETAVRKLAPYLVDHGWDVTVYGRTGASLLNDPAIDTRVRVITTPGIESKSLSTLSHGFTACVHAAVKRPDVTLVMNVANGFWLPLLRVRGIPTLINVDGIEWDRAKWNRVAKFVFHTGAKLTARLGTRMVYDSREIARRWESEFAVEGDFIPYGGDEPAELKLEPALKSKQYILMVARFVPENSVPEFIEAAKVLSERWMIVIVGSSGYGGELDEAVASLQDSSPNILWLGHISDDRRLHALWQHAGAYFHGHSVGGTNPALVQAMACGAPIVARDTPYNREVVGDQGMFVAPRSNAIVSGLTQVMEDPSLQRRLAEDALRRARDEYSWNLVNSRYDEALNKLVSRRAAKQN